LEKNYNSFKMNEASIMKSLFAILALILCQSSSAQLTIPAGNAYTSLSHRPLSSNYAYDRINSHYPASEINIAPGSTITGIRYYVESASGPSAIPVKIYMSNASGITSFSEIYGNAISGTTLVYNATIPATSFVTGRWIYIPLSTPFTYTGIGLQVVVEANYGSGSGSDFSTSKQFRTSLGSSQTWSSFATPISNNTYGIPLGNKPNLQIYYDTQGYSGNVSFDYDQVKASENTMALVTVNRNGGSAGTISVNYATNDGTAIAGSDYTPVSGTLTWGDGDNMPKMISVPVLSDFVFDNAETISLALSNPVGTTIENVNPATITIADVLPPMNGIYTVGTGGNYPSLTNAGGIFQAINTRIAGVSGPITINIISDLTGELGTHALNEIVGNYPVLIQPVGEARTISGTNQSGLIRFNGTDNVTINGSITHGNATPCALGGDASLRQLTFISTATTSTTNNGVIAFQPGTNGSMNNTVKNINITATNQYSTNFGVSFGAASPYNNGMVNQGNKLVNCSIQKVRLGISSRGISLAEQNSGTVIRNNDFSATGANAISGCAISIASENNPDVSFNTVYVSHANQVDGDATGIGIGRAVANDVSVVAGNVTGALVSNNKINGVVNSHTIGYSSSGIIVSGAATGLPNVIQNNMIAGVTGQSQVGSMVSGIHVVGAVASKTKLYHNSIWLTGDRGAQNRNQTPSFCISVTGIDPNLDMRNNIMFIDQIATIGGAVKMFAFGTTSTTFNNLISDYNTYFSSGPQDFGFRCGALTINGGTNYATLTDWKLANGADLHSVEVQPNFVSTADLHLVAGANPTIDGAGIPIAGITTDFDCNPRNPLTPTMGATENGVHGYSIAAGAGTNGSITPNGVTAVAMGADQNYTIMADCGYVISDVLVDGVSQGAIAAYTFTNVNASHTITAIFSAVLPTITAGGPTTVCLGESVVLTSSSATGNVWSTGETTQSITALASGNYWVSVNNGSCNSPISEPITINIMTPPAAPTITNSGNNFCEGESTTLTSSAATGNLWSNGATTQSIVVTTSGTYTVSYTTGVCTSPVSAPMTINVILRPATPTITASGPTTFCDGGTVILTSSSATGNVWSTGATTQSITIARSGTYTVRVSGGCNSLTSEALVTTVIPNPTRPTIAVTGSTTFCDGGSVVLTSSATEGNLWSNGETTQSITVTTGGIYSVTSTVNGCTSLFPASRTITVKPAPATPTISASGVTTFCNGGNVTLTSSSATGNLWSTGATTQSITVSAAGNYSVSVTSGGCTSALSDETTVIVNPIPATPTISASGVTAFCQGGSVTLTSSASSGNIWSNGETTQSITVSTPGTYSVSVNNGCASASSAGIIVTVTASPSTPTISASGSTTFCQGESVTLTSSSATGNVWSTGETAQSITVSTGGTYTVAVTNSGCSSAVSAGTTVTVNPFPTDEVTQNLGVITATQIGAAYQWYSCPNTLIGGATNQTYTPSIIGDYRVEVTLGSCTATSDCIAVTTLGNTNFNLNKFEFYPNPVTSILNIEYTAEFMNVEVFNMLGQKVLAKNVNADTTQIDMSHLPSATYLVKVSAENVSKTIKVVKK